MQLTFSHSFFETKADVMDDIKKHNTWPTTFVSGPAEGADTHWHSEEVHAYIMEGETDFLDAEINQRVLVKAGDKIVVPARALHAEGAIKDRIVYILALPKPLMPDEFLKLRDPEDL